MSDLPKSPLADAPPPSRPRPRVEPHPSLHPGRSSARRSASPGLVITTLSSSEGPRRGRLAATQSLSAVPTLLSYTSQRSSSGAVAGTNSSDYELADTRLPTRRDVRRLCHRRPRVCGSASDVSCYQLSTLVPLDKKKKGAKDELTEVPLYSKTLARMENLQLT